MASGQASKPLADRLSGAPANDSKISNTQFVWLSMLRKPIDKDDKDAQPSTSKNEADQATNGSKLNEPEFDVEVKLSDLQSIQDEKNPLYSAKTFEQLGL